MTTLNMLEHLKGKAWVLQQAMESMEKRLGFHVDEYPAYHKMLDQFLKAHEQIQFMTNGVRPTTGMTINALTQTHKIEGFRK